MMRKEDVKFTRIGILVAHITLSILMALVNGTSHPFTNLYIAGKPLPYILAACLFCIPLYMLMGFFYILGKHSLNNMKEVLRKCCFIFFIDLLIIYMICYFLYKFNIYRGSFMYYVLFNYPAALIFNTISLKTDATNLLFALTAIPGPLGFYIGATTRIRYERNRMKRGKNK